MGLYHEVATVDPHLTGEPFGARWYSDTQNVCRQYNVFFNGELLHTKILLNT